MKIVCKRIYESATADDGNRILVDRLWPRGVSKKDAHLYGWWKDVAPTTELRNWFNHEVDKWPEFKRKYMLELQPKKDLIAELVSETNQNERLTLLYGAKDEAHNQAVVLRAFIKKL